LARFITVFLVLSLILFAPPGIADEANSVGEALLQKLPDEPDIFPAPSRYNPIYWPFPDYAKTPRVCVGDSDAGTLIHNLWQSDPGTVNIHVSTQDYLSISLPPAYKNSFSVVEMSEQKRDTLRALILYRSKAVESYESGRKIIWTVLSIPLPEIKLSVTVGLWVIATASDYLISDVANTVKQSYDQIADQLRGVIKGYRTLAIFRSADGREFVRYLYAVQASGRDPLLLYRCYYPLKR
jgi:hypothetical protein